MIMVIRTSYPKARKEYQCDACKYILNIGDFSELPLTFAEKRAVVRARQNNYKIVIGEVYMYQVNTFDGFQIFRGIINIINIGIKYNLFEE
jgi:hypothetical protein